MEAQKYLEELVNDTIVFNEEYIVKREDYVKLFEGVNKESDIKTIIEKMDENTLRKYFEISQLTVDVQAMFSKIILFIDNCRHIDIKLDLECLNKLPTLLNLMENFTPFDTNLIVKEGVLIEKDSKKNELKFKEFKKSINSPLLNMNLNDSGK